MWRRLWQRIGKRLTRTTNWERHFPFDPEWREELEKVSHRPYTTAFAFQNPDHSAQEYMKSQPEQPYYIYWLVLEQDKGNGTGESAAAQLFQRQERAVECLTPAGMCFLSQSGI